MKKIGLTLLLIMILSLTAFTFVACNDDTYDPNALTIYGKESDLHKSYMQKVLDLYQAATGEKLNIIAIKDNQFEDKALAALHSDRKPDVLLHFNNADLSRFDVAENFEYLTDESWVNDIADGAKAYCTDAEGNLLGLPFWECSVSGCYYNKTLLAQLGQIPATTQTMFNTLCKNLREANKVAICWPAKDSSWMVQFALDPIFADKPQRLAELNANEIRYADIPEVKSMVEWLNNAKDKYWFGNDYMSTGANDIAAKLASGEAVMTFIWDSWFYTDFKEYTDSHDTKYTVDDFALMPVFMNTAKGGTYEGGNLNMMMVNKNSDKKQRALEFIRFCAKPENYNLAFEGISMVNVFKGQTTNIQSPMVTEAAESISSYERASTASTKIIGYNAEDAMAALNKLFEGKISIDGCINELDDRRIARAKALGVNGF